jgi:hypothetical protein
MLATGGLTGASGSVISVVVGTRSWATGEGSSSMALGSGVDKDVMHPSSAGGSICSCSSGAGNLVNYQGFPSQWLIPVALAP